MTLEYEIGDGADALAQNQYVAALNGTYWIDGWDWSLGDGDYEVDITAGSGLIELEGVETTSAQTIDLSGDVDTENPRKAVIYIGGDANVEYSLGDPAPAKPENEVRKRTTVPNLPDLSGENVVVVAEIWIEADATEIVGEDVRPRRVGNVALTPGVEIDADTVEGKSAAELESPIFGTGEDGDEVVTGTSFENGIQNYKRFEIASGGTARVNGWGVIYAQDEIVIDGTIDGEGRGGSGGAGSESNNGGSADDGEDGEDALFIPTSTGGTGGPAPGFAGDGGDGGSGDTRSAVNLYEQLPHGIDFDVFNEGVSSAGAGGGGGGGASTDRNNSDPGEDGSSPGGGGGGARHDFNRSVGRGGDGGDGGSFVALIAPKITITGDINCSAEDGEDGDEDGGIGSGGGGGGSGGVIFIKGSVVENSGTLDVSGGSGGQGPGNNQDGGDGADGEDGEIIIVDQS